MKATLDQILSRIVISQRGKLVTAQMLDTRGLEDDRVQKYVQDEGEQRCRLFWVRDGERFLYAVSISSSLLDSGAVNSQKDPRECTDRAQRWGVRIQQALQVPPLPTGFVPQPHRQGGG